jgi:hypothetical protein
MRRVGPKEGRHLPSHLHRIVNAEPLQSLNVKCAIVKITVSTFVPVNTLALAKHLSSHDDSPLSAPPREKQNR